MGWKDDLPPDAPPPLSGETKGRYFLRARRILEDRRIQALSDAVDKETYE